MRTPKPKDCRPRDHLGVLAIRLAACRLSAVKVGMGAVAKWLLCAGATAAERLARRMLEYVAPLPAHIGAVLADSNLGQGSLR
jgi:hypothetical protein